MIITRIQWILAGLLICGLFPFAAWAETKDSLQTTCTVVPYQEIKITEPAVSGIKLNIDGDNWVRTGNTFVGNDERSLTFNTYANYKGRVEVYVEATDNSGRDGFLYVRDNTGSWEIPTGGGDSGSRADKNLPACQRLYHNLKVGVRDIPFDHAVETKSIGFVTITVRP